MLFKGSNNLVQIYRSFSLCTKPVVLKMEESGKSSRGFRKKPSNCQTSTETCRHQVNERSVWLPQRSMKVNWQPHVFHLHNKKEKNSVRCKSESTKFKSVFDSHYQMHIRLTHNRSRRFHISVETRFSYQCLIQPVLYIVHVHRHQWYLGLLDWIVCSCPGRYSPLQSLLMFGAEFVPRSVVLSPVCITL
jgi:hypothetical protein